jgi:hypothetical protein
MMFMGSVPNQTLPQNLTGTVRQCPSQAGDRIWPGGHDSESRFGELNEIFGGPTFSMHLKWKPFSADTATTHALKVVTINNKIKTHQKKKGGPTADAHKNFVAAVWQEFIKPCETLSTPFDTSNLEPIHVINTDNIIKA